MRKIFTIIGLLALILVVMMGFASYEVSAQSDGCGLDEIDAGEYAKAIEVCTTYIKENPNDGKAYYNLGIAYYSLEDDESAITNFDKSIELDYTSSYVYAYRGHSYYYLGNYKSAVTDLLKSIELDEYNDFAYTGLGDAYYKLGDYNSAIENYTKSLEINDIYAYTYMARGDAYYILEADNLALKDYVNAILYYGDSENSYLIQERVNELIDLHVPAG